MVKSPVRDEQGRVVGVLGIFWDVTEQRHAWRTQLRQAQKMEAVGQLAGGIAHDFNNLLTVIIGNRELRCRSDLAEDARPRAARPSDHKAGDRAAELTRQLLGFAAADAARAQACST